MTFVARLRAAMRGLRGVRPAAIIDEWPRIQRILGGALDLPPGEREVYVSNACDGDARVHAEVLALLAASEGESLIDRPIDAIAAPLLRPEEMPTMETAEPAVVSHYELLERIPGGGMGVIYRARDTRLQRIVALKFLPVGLGADARAKSRFLLEARAAAALDHRNVCTIHEIGETVDGQPFIAMPFYSGETLAARIARGALPIPEAVTIATQIARGLAHAHQRGSIHRDIKPANVMLTPDGVVKILDFGIVKQSGAGFTRTGTTLGTLRYMSPEQLRRDTVDARTDIWSLGVVLYETLAGRRPFDDPDDRAVGESIAFAQPPSLQATRPDVPEDLSRLINDALAKDAGDRIASADAFASALESLPSVALLGTGESGGTSAAIAAGGAGSGEPRADDTGQVSPGGERRQATCVVARLSGCADLIERCAPQDVDQVMRRMKRETWEIVERHGGTVNEFSEERIVLLFGVPASFEDHTARATRAALELRGLVCGWRDLRPAARSLALHMAIDTGEAAVRRLDGSIVPYRIAGRPVRRAAQLCAHAHTDEILLSPEVQRVAALHFQLTPAAPLHLAGDEELFTPFTLVQESSPQDRLDQMAGVPLTEFTGRDAELAVLVQALEETMAGHGRFVTVTGEAGLGKSRLLLELRRAFDRTVAIVLIGRCSSYGQATPYLPFLHAMRQLLGLERTLGKVWTADDIAARLDEIGPGLEGFLPCYLRLLSITPDTHHLPAPNHDEQPRLHVQEALIALFVAAASRRPLVLLLEDWHWVDAGSHEALKRFVDVLSNHRLLVVTTTRGSQLAEWQHRDAHRSVMLRPLSSGPTSAMLQAVLDADEVPAELTARIYERTGGNPFFLEEIASSLLESGTIAVDGRHARVTSSLDTLDMPATVQAVIRTRLDRLDLEVRQALRAAAVVGRDFTRQILVHVLADPDRVAHALETLVGAGLVQQTAVLHEPAYRFRHALTQEAAYAGLLEHQRADLHGRVGTAIEDLYAGQLDDRLDRLAQHFSLAEDWPKAVHYGLKSAERMRGLSQFVDELRLLDRTREWVALLDEERRRPALIDILFRQDRACDVLGMRERQRQTVDELVASLESSDDAGLLADACLRKGELYTILSEFDRAEEALGRSLRLRRECGDALGERAALRDLGFMHWSQQRYDEALACNEAALRIARKKKQLKALVGDLHNLATVHTVMGNEEHARACLEEALVLSEPARNGADPALRDLWELRIAVLYSYGCLLARCGELDRALAHLGTEGEWTSANDNPVRIGHFLQAAAHVHLKKGMITECLQDYRRAIDETRRAQLAPQLGQALQLYGETLITLGREREALAAFDEATRVFASLTDRAAEALMWAQLARAHERLGNVAEAQSGWERALALRKQMADQPGEVEALEGLGRVARRHLPASSALRFYKEAIARSSAMGDDERAARLHNSAGIIEWTRARHDEALAHFERALVLFETLGDTAGAGQMMNSIGVNLHALGRRREARELFARALAHHERTGQAQLAGHALAAHGDVCWDDGETALAIEMYDRSLRTRQAIDDVRGEGWMLQRLARARASIGEHSEADALLTRAAQLSIRCGDEELMEACAQLRRGTSGLQAR